MLGLVFVEFDFISSPFYFNNVGDYGSSSVSSVAGHEVSKSTSRWSPRSNRAWIRCCASGHVSAVPKEVKESSRRSADGNETWLIRFFAAAIALRSNDAIR